jgi:membrane protein
MHVPRTWIAFGQKLNNDWVFNLSGLLAFNLLLATFPFLLMLLALLGITLGLISPDLEHQLIVEFSTVFPSQTGATFVQSAADNLKTSAGWLLALGLIADLFLGSRLFIVIENCFGIIFRVPARDLVRQNLMAIGMVVLFTVVVPLFLALSIVPTAIVGLIGPTAAHTIATGFASAIVFCGTIAIAVVLFGVIYFVVPNRASHWRSTWPGALLAGVLLVLYEKLFPFYTQTFLRPNNYGSIAGFALVIIIFYNFLAFILLLRAEVTLLPAEAGSLRQSSTALRHSVAAVPLWLHRTPHQGQVTSAPS